MHKLLLLLAMSCSKVTNVQSFLGKTSFTQQQQAARSAVVSIHGKDTGIIGSGAYIKYNKKNYVITAHHVIDKLKEIKISDGKKLFKASVVLVKKEKDLAILELDEKLLIKPLKIQKNLSNEKLLGQTLCYSGFPNGSGPMTICGTSVGKIDKFYSLHSYVWFGASGGAIVDKRGSVVGIVSAIEACSTFGIPIEDAGFFVEISQKDLEALN